MKRRGLVIDNFAGGGGASTGLAWALGRSPDIAINHDRAAIAMHKANHPTTEHIHQNIYHVDPADIARRGPIDLAWFSPDCTHHSKAKGGKPIRTPEQRSSRDLAWVVVNWARRARPSLIMLENVEEFAQWGPLGDDGRPCPERRGLTFRRWARALRSEGYRVQSCQLRGMDYGTPTVRRRLFIVARRDSAAIVWPAATHGPGLESYRTAAEIIDWSLPCPSIFDTAAEIKAKYGIRAVRPLAPATLARIARGVKRYVLDTAEPFIAPRHSLVAAFLAQHNTDMVGHDARKPLSTLVGRGSTQAVVAALLTHQYTSNTNGGDGRLTRPMKTVVTGGHAALVSAFMLKYYGTEQDPRLGAPLHSITTRDRFGLVKVMIAGEPYAIVDIGMRMLTPRELFRAQGFPDSYEIDVWDEAVGRRLTRTEQVMLCGNSVNPQVAEALVRANVSGSSSAAVA